MSILDGLQVRLMQLHLDVVQVLLMKLPADERHEAAIEWMRSAFTLIADGVLATRPKDIFWDAGIQFSPDPERRASLASDFKRLLDDMPPAELCPCSQLDR